MKILFDIDQLPSTSSTYKSKEERFAELEKRICEIDEKIAKVLALKGDDKALFATPSDDKTPEKGEAVADIVAENVGEKATCGSDTDKACEKCADASDSECSRVVMPKTRAERIAELECKLAAVDEKFDRLAASLGVEVCDAKPDDASSAITEDATDEPIEAVTTEATTAMPEEGLLTPAAKTDESK